MTEQPSCISVFTHYVGCVSSFSTLFALTTVVVLYRSSDNTTALLPHRTICASPPSSTQRVSGLRSLKKPNHTIIQPHTRPLALALYTSHQYCGIFFHISSRNWR